MHLLDSDQTLSAVRRSLVTHVLGALDDDFARLQVLAAVAAIDDVIDRLRNGDPVERSNDRITAGLAALADDCRATDPDASAAVSSVLDSARDIDDPRQRAATLRAGAIELARRPGPHRHGVLALFNREASMASAEEAPWMCSEAIESLQ